jgi:hypothetical protein
VQGRDTVHREAADDGEVRHAHLLLPVLLEERDAAQELGIAGEMGARARDEAPVDLADELQMPRERPLHEPHRPLLERLGQQRVVRVREAPRDDRPRAIPTEFVHVDEQAEQLRDGERGVRVVELEDGLVGQGVERGVRLQVPAHGVLQGRGNEEVLLLQPELLALHDLIVRVEDARDVLGRVLLADGLDVVAAVEVRDVELARGLRAPEAQRVHAVGRVAGHRDVVRHREDVVGVDPLVDEVAALVEARLDAAVELDRVDVIGALELPRAAVGEPVVGLLDLLAVDDRLPEDPVFVADSVAHRRDAEGRHRVEEARREAPEAAVAEPGVVLLLAHRVEILAEVREARTRLLEHPEVRQPVAQQTPEQVLHREVVDAPRVALVVALLGLVPAVDHAVARGAGRRPEEVARGDRVLVLAERVLDVVRDRELQRARVHAEVVVREVVDRLARFHRARP